MQKVSRNLGLSNVRDISESGRASMMSHAIQMLMQARAMARPTDEDLHQYGVSRNNFESLVSEIIRKNRGRRADSSINVGAARANPKARALGYGLAAAAPTAALGYTAGGSHLGSLGAGLLAGGVGAAAGKLTGDLKNRNLAATARVLRDHGVLATGALNKAAPILLDKTAEQYGMKLAEASKSRR